ncbi:zinc protease [Acinetobacter puyangensis]|uniref:zinc protease n=1 Tax=Acinetobacter puyangensis TaxID=1096779 RepID=UPI003A4E279A
MIGVVKVRAKKRTEAEKNPTEVKVDVDRYLTSGEITMAKLVFKDSIDYTKVKIIRSGAWSLPTFSNNAMTPFGNIYLPSQEYEKNKDFSKADSASEKHWFIHEMTHVWQYQLGTSNAWLGIKQGCKGGYTSDAHSPDSSGDSDLKAYVTDISGADANKKFKEFNFEQQGRIIEIWYDACYLQHENPQREHHQKSLKLLGYAERILRDFLQNPKDKNLLPKV